MAANTPENDDDPSRNRALKTALLPQYKASPTVMERFLVASHGEDRALERSANVPGTTKWADTNEIRADAYSYFDDNKRDLENEFLGDLTDCLGRLKAIEFCDVVAGDWFSGAAGQSGPRVSGLKAGIRDYISPLLRGKPLDSVVSHASASLPQPTFSAQEIAQILTVNDILMFRHIEEWKALHASVSSLSTDDIFLRRGLGLDKPLQVDLLYREFDFISSYSMAFTTTEKFSQMKRGKYPAMVSGDLALFNERILFFSPFVPGMQGGQLEVGVIPALTGLPLKDQESHGGIHEYLLDPRPFDR